MTDKQPEAQRLADDLEILEDTIGDGICKEAAAELRRLHDLSTDKTEIIAALSARITALETANREWVGLTETEQVQVAIDCGCADVAWLDFARAIEAKLKEKNA
jgi:hypothetical protein